jgi:hypothetical protein
VDIDGIERLIGRMYTAFVARDLTFFVSGGLVIAIAIGGPFLDPFANAISADRNFHWLAIPTYLAVSYILGVLLQEVTLLIFEHIPNWYKTRTGQVTQRSDPLIVRMERLHQQCSPHTILALERILFLKQIGATQLPTLIIVGAVLWVRNPPWFTIGMRVILAVLAFLCFWLFYRMSKLQPRIISGLTPK